MTDSYWNVRDAGIAGDGKPVAVLIQQLLDSGQTRLQFPAGEYVIEKTLKLPSGTKILADEDAWFRLADSAAKTCDDYLLTNADWENGNEDIAIAGGVWDGNQKGNPRPTGLLDMGYTGAMMHFFRCERLSLSAMRLHNAEAYYARFTHVHDFQIEDIVFDSDLVRPNNDGIHLGGNCSKGVIRRLSATTPNVPGDDLVALNADDALQRTEVRGMTCGPIEDIEIEDLSAHSCHTFVRILSVVSPIRNVSIRNLRGGCNVAALNGDGARGCRVKVFDEENPPFEDGVGLLENIKVSGLQVYKTTGTKNALIDIQERMSNFVVEDFERITESDCGPETPSIRLAHVEDVRCELDGDVLDIALSEDDRRKWEHQVERFDRLKIDTAAKGS